MGKVLIADDHPLVRDGLRTVVAVALDRCELFEASDLDEVVRIIDREGDFDLVLLDLNMPGNNGFAGLALLRARYPALPVVMVSAACDRQLVNEALRHGAAGFVPKSLARGMIAKALHQVLGGDVYVPDDLEDAPTQAPSGEDQEILRRIDTLTPQQRKVLELVVAGRLNKEIAYELDVTETTVKAHVSAILQKMRVFSRTQAVILANKVNFAPAPSAPQVSARAAAQ
ncbi:response regulator transcription factor [Niveispirillum sp.]|uniref:response regulator n=1 Tax=Niveispirillum sp. TaxID=1917217 RepID=UPI001B5FAA63|nr:response regulator transcription factor [Niveispirillum sp.]MBP7340075.1 response regulator transcription factor [Niveispirillum sp.]